MNKKKAPTPFHTAKTKVPGGDFYGDGIKNPVGKMRDSPSIPKISNKTKGKAPRSLA